jgi:hypothetical protein
VRIFVALIWVVLPFFVLIIALMQMIFVTLRSVVKHREDNLPQ